MQPSYVHAQVGQPKRQQGQGRTGTSGVEHGASKGPAADRLQLAGPGAAAGVQGDAQVR